MNTTKDALARAIAYLGAVEVAPDKFAVKTPGGRYRVFSATNLLLLPQSHDTDSGSGVPWMRGPLMPPLWTPERRFAWRYHDGETVPYIDGFDDDSGARITADLNTGKEVPA